MCNNLRTIKSKVLLKKSSSEIQTSCIPHNSYTRTIEKSGNFNISTAYHASAKTVNRVLFGSTEFNDFFKKVK